MTAGVQFFLYRGQDRFPLIEKDSTEGFELFSLIEMLNDSQL